MNIWILNHYAVPQIYYYLARSYNFAKQLIAREHKVTIFAASSVHNSDINLITNRDRYREMDEDGIHYVLFRARRYAGSGRARIINHIEGAWRMAHLCPEFTDTLGKPDIIYASAGQSLTLVVGIKLAKKLGIKCVSEVTDLWPESFTAYGLLSKANPILKLLYAGERWIYGKSDALIFSIEGGKDYVIEKKWDKAHGGSVNLSKVYHINNGVDLKEFDYNKKYNTFPDPDLDDPNTFKMIYTGSIRKANNLGLLLDVAKRIRDPSIRFIVWGGGDELPALRQRLVLDNITNVIFKGKVDKKYIPYVITRADLAVLNYEMHDIWKYGGSQNKLFEYFAGGIPVMTNIRMGYDLMERYDCGFYVDYSDPEKVAETIGRISSMHQDEYERYCANARRAAEEFDFKELTDKLEEVIEGC